jgi:hypothetical protein
MMGLRKDHRRLEERRLRRLVREASAGKLLERAPELTSLSLAFHLKCLDDPVEDTRWVRRVVPVQASASFDVPCPDRSCSEGGYDLTEEVLAALAAGAARFEGERACRGTRASEPCRRRLRYVATATYGEVDRTGSARSDAEE